MSETAIEIIPVEFLCIRNISGFCEVMGFLRSRKANLRIARKVPAERRGTTAWGTHQEEVGKPFSFGLVQNIT